MMKRTVLFASLSASLYTFLLFTWAIGRLSQNAGLFAAGHDIALAVVVTQALVILIVTPWLTREGTGLPVQASIVLVIIPWPLLLLAAELANLELSTLGLGQLAAVFLAQAIALCSQLLLRLFSVSYYRKISLIGLQAVTASVLWMFHPTWTGWFV